MKKIGIYLILALAIAGFVACSNPSADSDSGPVGSWKLTSSTVGGISFPVTSFTTTIYEFKSDNTFTLSATMSGNLEETASGTWSYSNNTITITVSGESSTLVLSGDTLTETINNAGTTVVNTYTKQ